MGESVWNDHPLHYFEDGCNILWTNGIVACLSVCWRKYQMLESKDRIGMGRWNTSLYLFDGIYKLLVGQFQSQMVLE